MNRFPPCITTLPEGNSHRLARRLWLARDTQSIREQYACVRRRLRFYFDVVFIAFGGGVIGFVVAKGEWSYAAALFVTLPLGIYRMWDQYRPDAEERKTLDARRREAERDYEHKERW
jgi:hypothetical protein